MPYLVIEGQDATGKTTQVERLAEYLMGEGEEVLVIGEPEGKLGGGYEGERVESLPQLVVIRDLVKNKEYDLSPWAHVALFTAARVEIMKKLIGPALEKGVYVVASRNWYSTLAYQGYGQGVELEQIEEMTQKGLPEEYWRPEKAVILTLPEEVRLARQDARNGRENWDGFESRGEEFQRKVNEGYLEIAKRYSVPTIEAIGLEETEEEIRRVFGV